MPTPAPGSTGRPGLDAYARNGTWRAAVVWVWNQGSVGTSCKVIGLDGQG